MHVLCTMYIVQCLYIVQCMYFAYNTYTLYTIHILCIQCMYFTYMRQVLCIQCMNFSCNLRQWYFLHFLHYTQDNIYMNLRNSKWYNLSRQKYRNVWLITLVIFAQDDDHGHLLQHKNKPKTVITVWILQISVLAPCVCAGPTHSLVPQKSGLKICAQHVCKATCPTDIFLKSSGRCALQPITD